MLYDTYGFPLDLTELILKENGMTLDKKEFDVEMEAQKTRARNAAAVEATDWVTVSEGETEFVGYDVTSAPTRILRYRKVTQKNKEFYQIVLSTTPFYAEMGGQVGDSGWLESADEKIEIYDTKRENGRAVHLSKKLPANVEAEFTARINEANRRATECNHTATHLLHAALREVLGSHVEQKGSYVSPGMLRFDFSHFQKVTPEELRKAERIANANVRKAIALDEHRHMPIAEALEMGAMALFGEKYGEEVRVVRYGDSVELCGGTHVPNTGNIGMIRIISESSIAAGIRRIEAVTGEVAEDMIDQLSDNMREVGELLHNAPDVLQALASLSRKMPNCASRPKNISVNASATSQPMPLPKPRPSMTSDSCRSPVSVCPMWSKELPSECASSHLKRLRLSQLQSTWEASHRSPWLSPMTLSRKGSTPQRLYVRQPKPSRVAAAASPDSLRQAAKTKTA